MLNDSRGDSEVSIGSRIRAARTRAGLTLEAVSRQIGISAATLSLIERDRVSVTIERVTRLAEVFGIELEDLLHSAEYAPALRTSGTGRTAGANHLGPGSEAPHPSIIDAAIACFLTRGYHGTSMRQIAHAAGVSVAGVYHYFPSKQQLLVTLMDETMAELKDQMLEAAVTVAEAPAEVRFHALVRALAAFHIDERARGFIGASEMRSIEEPERSRIAGLRAEVQRLIDEPAQAAYEAGVFRNPQWHFAGRVIATMCTSLGQWYDPTGPISRSAAADDLAAYATAMMRLPGPAPAGGAAPSAAPGR